MGFGAQKNISSYSFDRIVLIFGYIVQRTNTKIYSSHFFAISILNPNYDVINDIISGFAKVVVVRCAFHHCIAQWISWGEVVSVFLCLLQFLSYDVINDVIMSDADCTPGREPRSIAASFTKLLLIQHVVLVAPGPDGLPNWLLLDLFVTVRSSVRHF